MATHQFVVNHIIPQFFIHQEWEGEEFKEWMQLKRVCKAWKHMIPGIRRLFKKYIPNEKYTIPYCIHLRIAYLKKNGYFDDDPFNKKEIVYFDRVTSYN